MKAPAPRSRGRQRRTTKAEGSVAVDALAAASAAKRPRHGYSPPTDVVEMYLDQAIEMRGRPALTAPRNRELFAAPDKTDRRSRSVLLYMAGDLTLLRSPCVAIVGTRAVSPDGVRRTRKLASMLARSQIVVVSGLAIGVDTEAHSAALAAGGKTIAVIGTPMDRCNPRGNAPLQEEIYRRHLLISQFEWGSPVYPANFPQRNRTMAALSDATVIIEASDTSGTLHQAVECVNLGRPLFILRSLVEDSRVRWPAKFLHYPTVHVLDQFELLSSVLGIASNADHG
jgi:DNA processing protein